MCLDFHCLLEREINREEKKKEKECQKRDAAYKMVYASQSEESWFYYKEETLLCVTVPILNSKLERILIQLVAEEVTYMS